MNYKYNCLNPIAACGLNNLTENYARTEKFEEADAVFVRSAKMDELNPGANLLAVARAGAGVNNIPHAEYAKKGIVVFNTPGANANGVKELVIAGMLLASRDIIGGVEWVKENVADPAINKTAEKAKKAFAGTEIMGKKLGVIGLGAIGQKVANAAVGLGMEVYGFDPYISVVAAWNLSRSVVHCVNLSEVLSKCDYLPLHIPVPPQTKGVLNASAFASMKEGARLLNYARGELVDEAALLDALDNGKLAGYFTDFPTQALLGRSDVMCTPHLGASTPESEENCAVMAADELRDYLLNGNIRNSVNMPTGAQERAGGRRICVLHRNEPGLINAITNVTTEAGLNIENMVNKSKKDMAYTMLDATGTFHPDLVEKLAALPKVVRVRVL